MKNKLTWLVIWLILSYATVAFADTSLKAEVDKLSMTADEDLAYKLAVTSSAKAVSQPKFPEFDGFAVLSDAQTSEISISGRTQKTLVIYVFILAPLKTGRLKIGPSQVAAEGKNYSSEAFEIEVKQGIAKPQEKPEEKPSKPQPIPSGSEEPKLTL